MFHLDLFSVHLISTSIMLSSSPLAMLSFFFITVQCQDPPVQIPCFKPDTAVETGFTLTGTIQFLLNFYCSGKYLHYHDICRVNTRVTMGIQAVLRSTVIANVPLGVMIVFSPIFFPLLKSSTVIGRPAVSSFCMDISTISLLEDHIW